MEGIGEEIKGIAGKQFETQAIDKPLAGNTSWLIGKTKRLAIVGCSDSRHFAPYAIDPAKPEEAWEVWGVNNGYAEMPRWTRWFEIHPIKCENGKYLRRKEIRPGLIEFSPEFRGSDTEGYLKTLAALGCPVYMQKTWPEIIPQSVEYPLKTVLEKFGYYFTNTISYQIALGIMEGFTEIGLYGVDMATGSEYGPQRPSCEWMLGIAAGLGIKLTIPPQADLLKTRFLYAFQEREQSAWELKMANMKNSMLKRLSKSQNAVAIETKKADQYTGALEAVRECERVWANLMTKKDWRDPF